MAIFYNRVKEDSAGIPSPRPPMTRNRRRRVRPREGGKHCRRLNSGHVDSGTVGGVGRFVRFHRLMDLEPKESQTAVELYLTNCAGELRSSTFKTYRVQLRFLVEWCERNNITRINELNGRRVQEFRFWRRRNHDINRITERTQDEDAAGVRQVVGVGQRCRIGPL